MPDYSFRAATADGRVETGQLSADSTDEAMRLLEDRLLLVFELKESGTQTNSRRSRGKVGHADLVMLIRELATLANAGISLAEALETLKDASRDTPLSVPLGRMLTAIHAGEGFSAALAKTELKLPEYVFAMVRAGEATSNLGLALSRAADQMEFDAKMRSQTREALVYPIILISTGSIAILFIFLSWYRDLPACSKVESRICHGSPKWCCVPACFSMRTSLKRWYCWAHWYLAASSPHAIRCCASA